MDGTELNDHAQLQITLNMHLHFSYLKGFNGKRRVA